MKLPNKILIIIRFLFSTRHNFSKIFIILGAFICANKLLSLCKIFYEIYIRKEKNLIERYGKGSWALITGGSNNIGKGFALELAKRGFNICIMARNIDKLIQTKDQILSLYPACQIKVIQIDFKNSYDISIFDSIAKQLADVNISILVNNVGLNDMVFFHEAKTNMVLDMVAINMICQALLIRKFIHKLVNKTDNKVKSAIINISCGECDYPKPYIALSLATKIFNHYLSSTLTLEYKDYIDIISIKPFYVSSSKDFIDLKSFVTVTPEQCASSTLKNLGYKNAIYGHWKHEIFSWLIMLFPRLWTKIQNYARGPQKVIKIKNIEKRFEHRRKFLELQSKEI